MDVSHTLPRRDLHTFIIPDGTTFPLTSCFSCVACGDTRKTGKKSFCEDTSRSGKGPAAQYRLDKKRRSRYDILFSIQSEYAVLCKEPPDVL